MKKAVKPKVIQEDEDIVLDDSDDPIMQEYDGVEEEEEEEQPRPAAKAKPRPVAVQQQKQAQKQEKPEYVVVAQLPTQMINTYRDQKTGKVVKLMTIEEALSKIINYIEEDDEVNE